MPNYHELIKQQYKTTHGDSTELFMLLISTSHNIGLDRALAYLEQCVIEKDWLG
jgi:hypothetical protein